CVQVKMRYWPGSSRLAGARRLCGPLDIRSNPLAPIVGSLSGGFRGWFLRGSQVSTVREQPVVYAASPRITPHDVAHTVVVEIADPNQRRAERMRAKTHAGQPVAVLRQPHVNVIGRWIVPDDITGAILIEVAYAGDPIAGRVRPDRAAAGPVT